MAILKQIASIGLVILGLYFIFSTEWAAGTAVNGITQSDMNYNMIHMIPPLVCGFGIFIINYRELMDSLD
jgi:hypothetical protein